MLAGMVNYEGQMRYQADSLTVSVAGAPEFVLADVGMRMSQDLVTERLDSQVAFTVGEVQGSPIATKNVIYEVTLKQVSPAAVAAWQGRSEEHTSELQSRGHLVCRLLLEKKNK